MLWLLGLLLPLFALASLSRKAKQRSAVRGLREQFPLVARMRLAAAFPGIDGMVGEPDLGVLFDWILAEMCRRAGVRGFAGLMRWAVVHGDDAAGLAADVSRAAVDRLPPPVLAVIDGSEGRLLAGVILDQALTESGTRIAPRLDKHV